MVIITTVTYPTASTKEMAKRFLKAPPVPDYMTRKGPYISTNITDGIFIISVYELEKAKVAEGMEYLGAYMSIFFEVPDFKHEIKPFFDVAEAMKTIGMG
jgi:hypothetical protein